MINKSLKTIHNKYLTFFKFIFFLRYLFAIFLISLGFFLIIPNFFNYEKRSQIILDHISKKYNFDIKKYENIEFEMFPLPKLNIKNVKVNLKASSISFNVENFKIYPKIFSIYNYQNFQSNKIILKNNSITLETSTLQLFIKKLFSQKNKFLLSDLNLNIIDKNKSLVKINNIKFANFGYNQNIISGIVFGKKFKTEIADDFKNINFKLLNSGINAEISFNESQKDFFKSGIFKSKILNTNIKFNFDYNDKTLKVYNSYFRSKNLSFNNKSLIIFDPFFDIRSEFQIEKINTLILEKFDLKKLFKSKNILKKLNIKNEINYQSKKFTRTLINKLKLNIDLAYGRLNYTKQFYISENFFKCDGNINFIEEYPLLFFDCKIKSKNKKEFLKIFSIKTNEKNKIFEINFTGNLNILNKKINFKDIQMSQDYKASKEDLKYYKETFEDIIFEKDFINILNLKKIKKFILEIS